MTFNAAAINALFAEVVSQAQALGVFDRVNAHEPKSAPGRGLSCSFTGLEFEALPQVSGLGATSGAVIFTARIFSSFLTKPEDQIDPNLLAAACALIAAYSDGFTLGGTVMAVDLLGISGQRLSGKFAYVEQDSKMFRIFDLTVPVVVDAMFTQEA